MSYILKSLKKAQQERDRIGLPRLDRDMIDTPGAPDAGFLQPNLTAAVAEAIDLLTPEGRSPTRVAPFKGNMDVDRLEALLAARRALCR